MESFILADNQDITRAGLEYYVSHLTVRASICQATNKRELLDKLSKNADGAPIVVLDYTLFDLNGVEDLQVIARRYPKSQWLLFSHELSEDFIRQSVIEQNIGVLLKECSGNEIVTALKCMLRGKRYLCQQTTNILATSPYKRDTQTELTASELEILRLIAQGKTVKEIATIRVSSIHTIITHKKNIFRKLEVNNIYEATKFALRAGLVEMMEYYI
ncbi:MAG: response regulator transcription factor [Bacteroidales bacterium]|nr:response regulator transcription factor [Bacteroidales bacterium]